MTARTIAARLARLEAHKRLAEAEVLELVFGLEGESETEAIERLYGGGPGPRGVVIFLTPDDSKL